MIVASDRTPIGALVINQLIMANESARLAVNSGAIQIVSGSIRGQFEGIGDAGTISITGSVSVLSGAVFSVSSSPNSRPLRLIGPGTLLLPSQSTFVATSGAVLSGGLHVGSTRATGSVQLDGCTIEAGVIITALTTTGPNTLSTTYLTGGVSLRDISWYGTFSVIGSSSVPVNITGGISYGTKSVITGLHLTPLVGSITVMLNPFMSAAGSLSLLDGGPSNPVRLGSVQLSGVAKESTLMTNGTIKVVDGATAIFTALTVTSSASVASAALEVSATAIFVGTRFCSTQTLSIRSSSQNVTLAGQIEGDLSGVLLLTAPRFGGTLDIRIPNLIQSLILPGGLLRFYGPTGSAVIQRLQMSNEATLGSFLFESQLPVPIKVVEGDLSGMFFGPMIITFVNCTVTNAVTLMAPGGTQLLRAVGVIQLMNAGSTVFAFANSILTRYLNLTGPGILHANGTTIEYFDGPGVIAPAVLVGPIPVNVPVTTTFLFPMDGVLRPFPPVVAGWGGPDGWHANIVIGSGHVIVRSDQYFGAGAALSTGAVNGTVSGELDLRGQQFVFGVLGGVFRVTPNSTFSITNGTLLGEFFVPRKATLIVGVGSRMSDAMPRSGTNFNGEVGGSIVLDGCYLNDGASFSANPTYCMYQLNCHTHDHPHSLHFAVLLYCIIQTVQHNRIE